MKLNKKVLKVLFASLSVFAFFLMVGCEMPKSEPGTTGTQTSGSTSSAITNSSQTGTTATIGTTGTMAESAPPVTGLDGEDPNGIVIVIDPGHPSEVNSADQMQNGTTEVQMNWDVGLRLEQLIAQDSSLKCVKTRGALGTRTTNRRRAEIANEAGATLMVRLHCDSGSGSGFTVYYPDQQGTAQGVTGPSQDVIAGSRIAAQCIQDGLSQALQSKLSANPIKGDSATLIGSKQGALTGSIFSKVPTVTVEMVYLNNANDATFIKSAQGQNLLAQGLFAGIKQYVKSKNP